MKTEGWSKSQKRAYSRFTHFRWEQFKAIQEDLVLLCREFDPSRRTDVLSAAEAKANNDVYLGQIQGFNSLLNFIDELELIEEPTPMPEADYSEAPLASINDE